MRTVWVVSGAILLQVLAIGGSWAHLPAGVTYSVFQWPEGFEPVIDGNLKEWDIVPLRYLLTQRDFYDSLVREIPDNPKDFDIRRVMIGWSEPRNKLYLAAEIFDDIHQIDRLPGDPTAEGGEGKYSISLDDGLALNIDADHSGGKYYFFERELDAEGRKQVNNAQAQTYLVSVPPPDEYPIVNLNAGRWSWKSPWTEVEWRIEGEVQGPNTTFYEIALTPFAWLHWVGPDSSRIHDLTEGEVIGLTPRAWDLDLLSMDYDRVYLIGVAEGFYLADFLADFRLEAVEQDLWQPTSIGSVTWGRIKASFHRSNPDAPRR